MSNKRITRLAVHKIYSQDLKYSRKNDNQGLKCINIYKIQQNVQTIFFLPAHRNICCIVQ